MANDSNEQRNDPPSARKLRELRKKGQVSTSKDLVTAASVMSSVILLLLGSGVISGGGITLLEAAADRAYGEPAQAAKDLASAGLYYLAQSAVPLLLLTVAAAVIANIVVLRGIPASLEPIKPNLGRLNPVDGFGRLFGLKTWVELAKSILKVAVLGAVLAASLLALAPVLGYMPACGLGCVRGVFGAVIHPLLGGAAAVFVAFGLLDVGLQGWLFRRDQKMGRSELKRERKDTEGDPLIRSARRRLMSQARTEPTGSAAKPASIIVFDGRRAAVGLRYVRGETPVPVVVSKAADGDLDALLDRAARRGIKVAVDAELVALLAGTPSGRYVPQEAYSAAANALRSAGAI